MSKKIMLGVTGSIAAYKSADIARELVRTGNEVFVVMTKNATKFISPLTLETLTGNKVYVDMFEDEDHTRVTHIKIATEFDLFLIAPATFNIICKIASGVADDLLSSVIAAADPKKVIYAPAMNVNMFENPIYEQNAKKLESLGSTFVSPDEGMLACGVYAKGRLRNIPDIIHCVESHFFEKPLAGKKVLITAGATREFLDPIRFISNTSSGIMGASLAKACKNFGADVTLVLANSDLNLNGICVVRTTTVEDMYNAVLNVYDDMDIVFCAAAVSDYKPEKYSNSKIKKNDLSMSVGFVKNTDILYELGKRKKNQTLIGFAAEGEDLKNNALKKLNKKNLDFIIANDLSNFASKCGKVCVINQDSFEEIKELPKEQLAIEIVKKTVL